MKRIFDLLFSIVVLIFFIPLGIILSLCIIIDSRGGVFYKQERVGLNGAVFTIFKFRSMFVKTDSNSSLTVANDRRITRIGKLLRKFKLDEFPQFLNVIVGQMSVVGPRPEVKEFVDLYSDSQKEILRVKPGITDEASLAYFDENNMLSNSSNPKLTYIEEIMPRKIEINLKYISEKSWYSDGIVILKTFSKILRLR
jgi:lipopolysaccharide/colanic/teichoic acid biosynthesis glycosyltransferase